MRYGGHDAMNVERLTVGMLEENGYLCWGAGEAVVVDPGDEGERFLARTRELGVKVAGILCTHGHFDHVGAVKEVAEGCGGCAVWMHEGDAAWCFDRQSAMGRFLPVPERPAGGTRGVREGMRLEFCGAEWVCLETPGHTPGSVCWAVKGEREGEGWLFTGDTLFAGSAGRTDLPGGDPAAMGRSLARLKGEEGLGDGWRVLPGHGEESTMGAERRDNPFLNGGW